MTGVVAMAICALLAVESENGRNGGHGDNGRAVGILQQWECSVREACRIVGEKRWTYRDREDPEKAKEMCRVTLERHYLRGVTNLVDLACRWRNPLGNCPKWYRERVKKAMKEKETK